MLGWDINSQKNILNIYTKTYYAHNTYRFNIHQLKNEIKTITGIGIATVLRTLMKKKIKKSQNHPHYQSKTVSESVLAVKNFFKNGWGICALYIYKGLSNHLFWLQNKIYLRPWVKKN